MTRQFSKTMLLQRAKELIKELNESIFYLKTERAMPSSEQILSTGKKMNLFIKRFMNQEITLLTSLEDNPYFLPLEFANTIHQLEEKLNQEIKKVNMPKEEANYLKMKEKIKYLFSLSENSSEGLFNSPTKLKKIYFPDGSNAYYFLNAIQKGKYHIDDCDDQNLSILTRYLQFFCKYQKLAKRFPKSEKQATGINTTSCNRVDLLLDLAEHSLINFDMKQMNYYQNLLYPLIKENYLNPQIEENTANKTLIYVQ